MLYNKNNVRKTNDKKILHKVGKQWKVVSVALLMAIGGAAVATHANANADVNDQPYAANQPQFKQPVQKNKPVKPASSEGIHYYPAASGAAASYFDKVESDNGVAAKNYNTVNRYVQSLNAEYNPQVHSYSAKSASASSAESNDAKLAKSYSNVNQNPNTAKTINSLAAKNSMDPSVYMDYVENTEQTYSGEVASASADSNAASDISSLVSKLENTNLFSASLSATTALGVANSNYVAAKDIQASIDARYPEYNDDYGTWLTIADKLSAGAHVLEAQGNPAGYQAALNDLTTTQVANGASQAAARNAVNKAINSDVKSAIGTFKASSANSDDLEGFADDILNGSALVSSGDNAEVAANPSNPDLLNGNGSEEAYNSAVSAGVAEQFAGTVRAAANSLYGRYNPESLTASARASVATSARNSASDKVTATSDLAHIASDNSNIINELSTAVGNGGSDAKASVVASYLKNPTAYGFGIHYLNQTGLLSADGKYYAYGPQIATYTTYTDQLKSLASSAANNATEGTLIGSLVSDSSAISSVAAGAATTKGLIANDQGSEASVAAQFTSDKNALQSVSNILSNEVAGAKSDGSTILSADNPNDGKYKIKTDTNFSADLTSGMNGQMASLAQGLIVDNNVINTGDDLTQTNASAVTPIQSSLASAISAFSYLAASAEDVSAASTSADGHLTLSAGDSYGLSSTNVTNKSANYQVNDGLGDDNEAGYVQAALLSDGVDVDALNDEADAISDVTDTVSNAIGNSAVTANNLSNGLSTAASSADSAMNSANNASAEFSASNDEDVTLASYYANSYSDAANTESATYSNVSSALNSFFRTAAGNDPVFNSADTAYADAEAAAANDKKLGVEYSKVVFNNSPHFLDVLKGAKLHSSYEYGSQYDTIVGSANKGDRLTVLGVNFDRQGNWRGQTHYLVLDNNTGKKGFFTGQPQYSKAAYLNAVYDTNNVNVSVKTLQPVTVRDNINGGNAVKTLPAGTVVNNVSIVRDNPNDDAMGFTKVETSDYNFFTANTDYVKLNNVVPKNNNNNENTNFNFNLDNTDLAHAYNNNSQY